MKKLFLIVCLMGCLIAGNASAIDISVFGVVTDGVIQASGNYNAQGGVNPYYQNQYQSSYFARGTAGLLMQNSYSGAFATQEQFQIDSGYGKFLTKSGSGTLINNENEQSGETTGILTQNAIGFAGAMIQGMTTTTFATADGLSGTAESEGLGIFSIGAASQTISGSSNLTTPIKVEELTTFHYTFGPGVYKVKAEIVFPK